jgi:hypothetical protein
LTEEELIDFVLEELSEETAADIDRHLEKCFACARELEAFYTAQEEFPAELWAVQRGAFIAELRRKLFGATQPAGRSPLERLREGLAAFLETIFYPIPAPAPQFGTPGEPMDLESKDRVHGLFIVREKEGDITIRLDSKEMALEGERIEFFLGKQQWEAPLVKVDQDCVGLEVIIPREELKGVPPEAQLRARLVEEKDQP